MRAIQTLVFYVCFVGMWLVMRTLNLRISFIISVLTFHTIFSLFLDLCAFIGTVTYTLKTLVVWQQNSHKHFVVYSSFFHNLPTFPVALLIMDYYWTNSKVWNQIKMIFLNPLWKKLSSARTAGYNKQKVLSVLTNVHQMWKWASRNPFREDGTPAKYNP